MFDSTLFDVVIALIFVFFVFSLLVSGINEGVRKILNTRSKGLWVAVRRMFDEGDVGYRQGWTPFLPRAPQREEGGGLAPQDVQPEGEGDDCASLFDQFFNHPMIARLDPTPTGGQSRLSHIPPSDFARAVVDVLAPRDDNGNPQWEKTGERIKELPEPLRSQMELLWREASTNIEQFRMSVESWFDASMQRVTDWYKKRTRYAMFAYGLAVAALFNVSAVVITHDLYENDVIRETVVGLAEQRIAVAEAGGDSVDPAVGCKTRECFRDEVRAITDTGLPLLWRRCPPGNGPLCGFEDGGRWLATIVGWFVTAVALSMGASFWFAVLKRAFRIRSRITGTESPA